MSKIISENNPIRRRLFAPDNSTEEAKIDNFANILQESIKTDCIEKSKKWNFDFVNEVPLDGDYEWYHTNGSCDWIGVKKLPVEDVSEKNSLLTMKTQNEITPKGKQTNISQNRKRRQRSASENEIRKRISF